MPVRTNVRVRQICVTEIKFMVFSSPVFLLVFLPAVIIINKILPFKMRNVFLLFANLVMNINELKNSINEEHKLKYSQKEDLLMIQKILEENEILVNYLMIIKEDLMLKL